MIFTLFKNNFCLICGIVDESQYLSAEMGTAFNVILKTKIDMTALNKFIKLVISVSVFNVAEGNRAYHMPCACMR